MLSNRQEKIWKQEKYAVKSGSRFASDYLSIVAEFLGGFQLQVPREKAYLYNESVAGTRSALPMPLLPRPPPTYQDNQNNFVTLSC
jgi:hypothetical protein